MKTKKLLLFLLTGLLCMPLSSQDTLYLLNGGIMQVDIQEIGEYEISYEIKKKDKTKLRERDLSTVFSYRFEDNEEVIVYEFDPERGNIYEIEEMKAFVIGERDALENYHPNFSNILGVAVGLASGFMLEDDVVLAASFPLIYSSLVLAIGTKVDQNHISQERYANSPYYKDGYKRIAKGRKFFGALKYSAISMLASFAVLRIADS